MEQFKKKYPIAAKWYEIYRDDLRIWNHVALREMLAEIETECNIHFHRESSVKIKELENNVKELENLNNSYQKCEHEYTATELAAKLQALGYFGSIEKRSDIWNDNIIVGKETHRIEI